MRCSYRCNMWCNCKKPAKPYSTPPSISAPSESEITLTTEAHWIYFTYTPTDTTLNVTIESNDPNVAYSSDFSYQNGQAQFLINPVSGAQGTVGVTIVNNDEPEETYTINVTVTPGR